MSGHDDRVASPQLPRPLVLMTTTAETTRVIHGWAQRSLRPVRLDTPLGQPASILFRTSGTWNSVVAASGWDGTTLSPIVVFKNSIALWQWPRVPVPDGTVDASQWPWLRRGILIHNPGLDGLLQLLDATCQVAIPSPAS